AGAAARSRTRHSHHQEGGAGGRRRGAQGSGNPRGRAASTGPRRRRRRARDSGGFPGGRAMIQLRRSTFVTTLAVAALIGVGAGAFGVSRAETRRVRPLAAAVEVPILPVQMPLTTG